MTHTYQHFGIIGAGAWGTALATVLRRAGRDVTIWSHNPEGAHHINHSHENRLHLSGLHLDPAIKATHELNIVASADVLLFATPAQHLRKIANGLMTTSSVKTGTPVVITSKGIELGTSKLMSEVVAEEMPNHGIVNLSGPSFAEEVAEGKPTALTLATADKKLGEDLSHAMAITSMRLYLSDDIIGAQIGGALKNVIAIACGIVTGKQLGENARAALITRGLAEMMRLGLVMGARSETFMGLSGMGDLLLTCSSQKSRNMSLGIALGQGQKLEAILGSRNSVAEGVPTAAAALALAQRHGVEMPVVASVTSVLNDSRNVDQAIADLLARPLKTETN